MGNKIENKQINKNHQRIYCKHLERSAHTSIFESYPRIEDQHKPCK